MTATITPSEIRVIRAVVEERSGPCPPLPGCWTWRGSQQPSGPQIKVRALGGRWFSIRRVLYQEAHGSPVPTGYFLRDSCGNLRCLQVEHLDLCTWGRTDQERIDLDAKIRALLTPTGADACAVCRDFCDGSIEDCVRRASVRLLSIRRHWEWQDAPGVGRRYRRPSRVAA